MKKVLIISEYITPVQGIGAIRWTKLAKYLAKNEDCEITVLTDEKDFDRTRQNGNWQRFDATLAPDKEHIAHYYAVPNGAFLRRYYAGKNAKLLPKKSGAGADYVQSMVTPKEEGALKRSVRDIVHYIKDIAQMRGILRYAKMLPWDFDVMISTYGPAWPHLAAQTLKRQHPSTVWLADYRDACWMPQKSALLSGYYKRFAAVKTARAERVIMAWETLAELLYLTPRQQHIWLTNGFDPDDKQPDEGIAQFRLTYTGVLYGVGQLQYDIGPVFRALKVLEAEGTLTQNDAKVCYAGGDTERFLAQATREDAKEFAMSFGVLPRTEALQLQQASAALLVTAWNTTDVQGYITGKIFEYMMTGRPIVVTMTGNVPNSLQKQMVQRGNLGFCYEQAENATDFPQLVDYLRTLYLRWRLTGSVPQARDEEYVQTFSYPQLAHRVAVAMDETLLELRQK